MENGRDTPMESVLQSQGASYNAPLSNCLRNVSCNSCSNNCAMIQNKSDFLGLPPSFIQENSVSIGVVLLFLLIAGLVLNAATLSMFFRHRLQMKSSTNFFILNLAISDVCCIISSFPVLLVSVIQGEWFLGDFGCAWYGFNFLFFGSVSINTMTAIAIQRYYSIKNGQHGVNSIKKYATRVICVVWSTSFTITILPFIGWSNYLHDHNHVTCALNWKGKDFKHVSLPIIYFLMCLLIPVSVKAYFYYSVYQKVTEVAGRIRFRQSVVEAHAVRISTISKLSLFSRNSRASVFSHRLSTVSTNSSFITSNPNSSGSIKKTRKARVKGEKKLAAVMVLMVIISVFSWYPYGFVVIALHFTDAIPAETIILLSIAAKASVVYNPLIYVVFNKKFRQRFLQSLRCTMGHRTIRPAEQPEGPPHFLRQAPRSYRLASQPALAPITEAISQQFVATPGPQFTPSPTPLNVNSAFIQEAHSNMSLPEPVIHQANRDRKTTQETLELIKNSRHISWRKGLVVGQAVKQMSSTLQLQIGEASGDSNRSESMPRISA